MFQILKQTVNQLEDNAFPEMRIYKRYYNICVNNIYTIISQILVVIITKVKTLNND